MTLSSRLEESFVAGLILVGPLVVTACVLKVLVGRSLGLINQVVRGTGLMEYTGRVEFAAQVTAVVLVVATITALGFLPQRRIGQRTFGSVGRTLLVPESQVYETDTSVRRGRRTLVTTGTTGDDDQTPSENRRWRKSGPETGARASANERA